MNSAILASIAVPLMIVAATLIIDRMEQRTVTKHSKDLGRNEKDKQKDPPNDLIDLSGGTFGI